MLDPLYVYLLFRTFNTDRDIDLITQYGHRLAHTEIGSFDHDLRCGKASAANFGRKFGHFAARQGKGHGLGVTVKSKVARDLVSAAYGFDRCALEADRRKLFGVEEIRAPQVVVATWNY